MQCSYMYIEQSWYAPVAMDTYIIAAFRQVWQLHRKESIASHFFRRFLYTIEH
jgi:hypothetical protein